MKRIDYEAIMAAAEAAAPERAKQAAQRQREREQILAALLKAVEQRDQAERAIDRGLAVAAELGIPQKHVLEVVGISRATYWRKLKKADEQ